MTRLAAFYPILPDAAWVARLARLGVGTIQLRIKDADEATARREIAASLQACAEHDATLVVNDHWREAIELAASYIHLGQGDLTSANLPMIRAAGLRLGISTHSQKELETALAAKPDYVALGPIYETTLKQMPFAPQGLDRIGEWRARLSCPLVAIGGITLERAPDVYAAGADSIAVVSDVVSSADPEARVRDWLALTAIRTR